MLWGRLPQKGWVFIIDWVNSLGRISHITCLLPQVSSAKEKPENEDCDFEGHEGQFCYQNLSLIVVSLLWMHQLWTAFLSGITSCPPWWFTPALPILVILVLTHSWHWAKVSRRKGNYPGTSACLRAKEYWWKHISAVLHKFHCCLWILNHILLSLSQFYWFETW